MLSLLWPGGLLLPVQQSRPRQVVTVIVTTSIVVYPLSPGFKWLDSEIAKLYLGQYALGRGPRPATATTRYGRHNNAGFELKSKTSSQDAASLTVTQSEARQSTRRTFWGTIITTMYG